MRFFVRLALFGALAFTASAGTAAAATLSLTTESSGAKTVNYVEGAGMTEVQANNGFMVYRGGEYQVADNVPITGAGGCGPEYQGGGFSFPFFFSCPGAGVTKLFVDLGDVNDSFLMPGNDNSEGFPMGFGGTSPPAGTIAEIHGGPGNDSLGGGDEDDVFVEGDFAGPIAQPNPALSSGADLISGDDGSDTVDYSGRGQSVNVSLGTGNADDGEMCPPPSQDACEGDTDSVENVIGGSAGDILSGDTKQNTISGMAGGDTIDIRDGDAGDHAICGPGTDRVTADSPAQDQVDADCERVDYAGDPNTIIDSGPSGTVTTSNVSFTFHSTEPGSTFECSLSSGGPDSFSSCTSPKDYTGLADGTYTFKVRATDAGGNTDPSPATQSFTVDTGGPPDTTPPDTIIDAGPSGTVNTRNVSFTFHSTEAGSSFECRLDSSLEADFQACSSPKAYADLADGPHSFDVRATDVAGNTDPTPDSRSFTVDATPPDTIIDTGPSGTIATNNVSFTFHSTEGGSSFECKLDDAAFESCGSPKDYLGLVDGDHAFQVRATDAAGNTDQSPAVQVFTVDTTAPDTVIDSGPSGTVSTADVNFVFHSTESGSTFECSLVPTGDPDSFSSCSSPKSYTGLADDDYTFKVRATDAAGNLDTSPASRSFTVDTSAPPDTTPPDTIIDSGPAGAIPDNDARFTFHSTEDPQSSFECQIDNGGFTPCTSPQDYIDLPEGTHTFQVRATDQSGNTDASPASRTFTVDLTPPDTFIDSGPSGTVSASQVSFTFHSSEDPNATFACRIDSAAFAPCTSPASYPGIGVGTHTFEVRATDASGRVDPTPASRSFTVEGPSQQSQQPQPQPQPSGSSKAPVQKCKGKRKHGAAAAKKRGCKKRKKK